jgi:small subunit ribosomal protein S20
LGTRSAIKAHRQSIKRRLRNRAVKSATKTAIKHANEAIVGGDVDAAREAVRNALSTLDRAAQKGVLHPNNAGRRKSRLLLKYNASVAALQPGGADEERPAKKDKKAAPKAKASKKAPAKKTKK